MAPRYAVIHKEPGETPLQAVEKWRLENPAYASLLASYAGRLDPMASGKLLVLLGDECKKQESYTGLDKEYAIEIVLDLATDTGDALGIPSYDTTETHPERARVREAFTTVLGTHRVPYPAFSSKTVGGKSLFMYALEGTLDTIRMPEHDETVYRIRLLKTRTYSPADLLERITVALRDVPRSDEASKALGADFRQDVIRAGWRVLFEHMPEREFTVLKLRVACGSGTYMRTLAARIAKELGTHGFALSIKRTKIGTYAKLGPFRLWTRSF
ncbi:MAG: tRNA pseudouridine55 synthase [Candidatus Parcubacteria bacterium]|nr:tRNA pseudouridine55 synthase [Candidatus Parcubacteria bacterium]